MKRNEMRLHDRHDRNSEREAKGLPRRARGPGAAFAATVLLAFLCAGCPDSADSNLPTAAVERGPIEVVVRATGSLKAKKSTEIHSEVHMETKIIGLVPEGTWVKPGDLLVELDPTSLEKAIENDEESLDQAKAELEAARTDLEIQKADGENQKAKAELALEQAKQELEKYEQGDAPIQERKLIITEKEAKSKTERLRENYEEMLVLKEQGFFTETEVEEERIQKERAEVDWETAKEELKLFRKYTRPMTLAKKRSAVDQTENDLEAVKKRTSSQRKQQEVRVAQRERRVRKLQEQIEDHRKKLEKMKLLAPTAGIVIYGEPQRRAWRSDDDIQVGAKVWPQHTIITLPDLSEMTVIFRVHESNIDKIEKGMTGTVTVESFGNRSFQGEIIKIANLANTGGWRSDPDVKQFDVEMLLSGTNLALKPGVTAKVEIVVEKNDDALRIPVSAVHGKPGDHFCFVRREGAFHKIGIGIGIASDRFVEVVSGLAEGDEILLGEEPESATEEEDEENEGGEERTRKSPSRRGGGRQRG